MTPTKILIANRGEVALRVARTATEMGIGCVTVFAEDDAGAWRLAGEPARLRGQGPAAYLDAAGLLEIAREAGCDAVHPGYGFLSERADFASACEAQGLAWIGPTPEQLELFGDKARARALAAGLGIPVSAGIDRAVSLDEAKAFLAAQNGAGIMIKAIAGGGGRGMRAVRPGDDFDEAYRRCASEAEHAFGVAEVYVERLVERARHIEVQIVGDGRAAIALGERDCTLQRRFQKLVEIAPAPTLSSATRAALSEAALAMARASQYRNLGTFEFLVDSDSFVFMEANPRLQVEHTITEEVTGLDLVRLQIEIAGGADLASAGLAEPPTPRGCAIQWRINVEAAAELTRFTPPGGPGIRVDTHAAAGEAVPANYDSLLAKLVVRAVKFRRGRAAFASRAR